MKLRALFTAMLLAGMAGQATAQTTANPPVVGILSGAKPRHTSWFVQFDRRFAKLGWVDGATVQVLFRDPEGDPGRMEVYAEELIAANPAVIVASGPSATLEAVRRRLGNRDIPVVAVAVDYDLVERGFVDSLADPGGNITGVMALPIEMTVKRVEILRETLPDARLVAVFVDDLSIDQLAPAQQASSLLGLELVVYRFDEPPYDFKQAVAASARQVDTFFPLASPVFARQRSNFLGPIADHRLPVFAPVSYAGGDGVVIAQGVGLSRLFARAANYVYKLLQGAKPTGLPIDRSREFDLIVNLKVAAALGIDIPRSILLQADQLIE